MNRLFRPQKKNPGLARLIFANVLILGSVLIIEGLASYGLFLRAATRARGPGPEEWTEFLEKESESLRIPLINPFTEFRSLPYHEVISLFIPKDDRGQTT